MMQKYIITKDADMLAPRWLADRINYKTVKFLYGIRDRAEVLKGVKINDQTDRIGDTVCIDGKRLFIERR
jgi:hypothetical protein